MRTSAAEYQGPAYECRMIYEPVAGRAAHKARKRKIEPPVFTLWLAPVQSASLPQPVLIPVAAKGTLDGKKFVALAKKATIAGSRSAYLQRARRLTSARGYENRTRIPVVMIVEPLVMPSMRPNIPER